MKKSKYSRILDNVLDEKVPHNHHLAPQILSRIQKNKGANMSKRMKVLVPMVTVLVMLIVVMFTVPAVAQAIQRWIGYVPGFGLVQEGSVRVIDQPVQVTQDGVTLTVTGVTSSSKKTVINYNLKNIPITAMNEEDSCKGQDARPDLVLSDGSERYLISLGGEVNDKGYFFEATYNGVPENVTEMTLVIKCLSQTIPGSISWQWKVPLSFDPQTPALTMAPVFEVPTVSEQETSQNGLINNLVVNQIIPLSDGYIVSGSMEVETISALTVDEMDGFLEDVTIVDAQQQVIIPTMPPDDFFMGNYSSQPNNKFNWAFKLSEKEISWPITITVNTLSAITEDYAPSTFQVEVGDTPQPDQIWMLDKDILLGLKSIHVVSLKRLVGNYGLDGYEFTFIYNPAVDFSYAIEGCEPSGGGGEGILEAGKSYTKVLSCRNSVPIGTLNVTFTGHGIEKITGPWQVSVAEPAAQ